MGGKFSEKARLIESVGYDAEDMASTFGQMVEAEDACLFIGDAGAIGGIRSQHVFNYAHWTAQELFWWSEGREGLRLLTAFEEWAAEKCGTVRMVTLEAVNPDRMGRLYEKRGYRALEHGYIKAL